jgi:hypothetical protein
MIGILCPGDQYTEILNKYISDNNYKNIKIVKNISEII